MTIQDDTIKELLKKTTTKVIGRPTQKIDREYNKLIVKYWSLNGDDTHSVPQRNEIWIYGSNNEGQEISEEIHLNGPRLEIHKAHQSRNLRPKHQNLDRRANKSKEGGGVGTTTI